MALASLLLLLLGTTGGIFAWVSPIEREFYKLWNSIKDEEFIARGIVFYPNANAGEFSKANVDLYTDDMEDIWRPQLEELAKLGVNAIRIYSVDPTKPHDRFMCALSKLGIYALVGIAAPCENCAIDAAAKAPDCYPADLKLRAQAVINAFIHFPNLLGFSAGNEVNFWTLEEGKSTIKETALCQKALVRDMKRYIAGNRAWRKVPIGVVSSYQPPFDELARFYNCRNIDEHDQVDWYGINPYLYCDPKERTFESSEYVDAVEMWRRANLSVPILLTEYGCITRFGSQQYLFPSKLKKNGTDYIEFENQRTFLQTKWFLTMREVQDVFQGSFAYKWSVLPEQSDSAYPFNQASAENFGIGYQTPKNCRGGEKSSIPCKYERKPEWADLEMMLQTHKELTPLKRSDVQLDDRINDPECPTDYNSLDSFTWSSEKLRDLPYSVAKAESCDGAFDDEEPDDHGSGSRRSVSALSAACVWALGYLLTI